MGRRWRGRLLLLALAVLFVLPISVAWMLNTGPFLLRSEDTVNHGTLIPGAIRPATDELRSLDGRPLPEPLLEGAWTLAYVGPDACSEACRRALVVMRQVRLAQGREIDRIRRLLVVAEPPSTRERLALLGEHRGLRVAQAPAGWAAMLAQRVAAATGAEDLRLGERIWLLDPEGRLVLHFRTGDDPRGMIDDLKRLLKLSRIG